MTYFNSIRSVKYFDCHYMIFKKADTLKQSFKACIFVYKKIWLKHYLIDDVKSVFENLKTNQKLQVEFENFSQTFIDNSVFLEKFECIDTLTKDLKSDIIKTSQFIKCNVILFVEINRLMCNLTSATYELSLKVTYGQSKA